MQALVKQLADLMIAQNIKLVTAESCTGGLLATTLTHEPGASEFFERGFITYSNESKTEELGVAKEIIDKYGAVSEQTAEMMAKGALEHSQAQLSIAITGIAGPSGGSDEKPVGLVYFGFAREGGSSGSIEAHFTGNRHEVQVQATMLAIKKLISLLKETADP